jgi:hypothetical protein
MTGILIQYGTGSFKSSAIVSYKRIAIGEWSFHVTEFVFPYLRSDLMRVRRRVMSKLCVFQKTESVR